MTSFDDLIRNHFYINLDERNDRMISCEEQLKKWDIKPHRFSAIKPQVVVRPKKHRSPPSGAGILGCGMSHLKCIQTAKEEGWEYCAIFEDDIMIPKPNQVKNIVNRIIESGEEWDILLLSGNAFSPHKRIEEDFIQVQRCFTTTAYIVKNSFYDTLIQNLREGVEGLIRTEHRNYSLDNHWMELMKDHVFLLIKPPSIYQKADYSNIENKFVDYKNSILNIEK